MVKQAALYVAAFFFPFFFPILFQVNLAKTGTRSFLLFILLGIFTPLQGFFNFFVFLRPRLISFRKKNPEISFVQAFLITAKFRNLKSSQVDTSADTISNEGNSGRVHELEPDEENDLIEWYCVIWIAEASWINFFMNSLISNEIFVRNSWAKIDWSWGLINKFWSSSFFSLKRIYYILFQHSLKF